ncbi:transposase [Myceligenerans sp. I2]|uniref:Transposase n=1 Tax=Myceligenerans indicum TaxID=2593663 RepID=A0ABS1LRM5_9MICO|nr:transposase [Myceligenerans indicum]MBL0888946.1 transposase [Myceligenerans indicum]
MSTKRYPDELKARAVRMVLDHREEYPTQYAAIKAIAQRLDVGTESLRLWVKRADVDAGREPGVTSQEREEIKRLKRENAELKRANEILKSAASFFARELDPPRK